MYLAAQSSSSSLVVRPLVRWLVGGSLGVCEKVAFRVTYTYLPSYLCDSSDGSASSDGSDTSDISDSSDNKYKN